MADDNESVGVCTT